MARSPSTPQRTVPRERKPATPHLPTFNGRRNAWRLHRRTLVRKLKDEHFINYPRRAVAYDQAEYLRLRPYFDRLRVQHRATGESWSIAAEDFDRLAERIDRGAGPQFMLALDHWEQECGPRQLPLLIAP
jgi:hypothetical protein